MSNLVIGPANEERKQTYEKDGHKFIFKAYDPYGFIKVTSLTGNKTLDGQFTTWSEAEKAANRHILLNLKNKKKDI